MWAISMTMLLRDLQPTRWDLSLVCNCKIRLWFCSMSFVARALLEFSQTTRSKGAETTISHKNCGAMFVLARAKWFLLRLKVMDGLFAPLALVLHGGKLLLPGGKRLGFCVEGCSSPHSHLEL